MMSLLAQARFTENSWLDDFQLHFGEWVKQIVDWTDQNLELPIKIIEWPFRFLFDLLMSDDPNTTSIMDIPWYWVAIAFFVIGSMARNTRVGVMVALMVATCGLLGPDYWSETTKTFGMVFVSVFLCAIIGIPLGILCGRVDAVWNVTRPTLDAMQVIHSFVYMLPFIFFWKIGEVSATMVTMVFALPPLVRLTNLGIRQVPEDVVEASRSYGASEKRVLTDVQLPLARPAIMTGLNQTLLLAISMLGIAAIMGAGGLGKLLLRAINSQDLPLAASGGLAFFLVAVVLDRMSQREKDDGLSLFARISEALTYRKDAAGLLAVQAERMSDPAGNTDGAKDVVVAPIEDAEEPEESPAPVSSAERSGLLVGGFGGLLAIISVLLPWGTDTGLISSWGRLTDETGLLGQTSFGLEATGGSVFAIFVLLFGLVVLAAAVRPLMPADMPRIEHFLNRVQAVCFIALGIGAVLAILMNAFGFGLGLISTVGLIVFGVAVVALTLDTWVRGTPRMGADGVVIAALGALGASIGYFVLREAPGVESYSHGFGVYVALVGSAIAVIGGLMALRIAPYGPRRPFKLSIAWPLVAGAVFVVGAMFVGSFSAWMFDERLDSLISAEDQALIDQLEAEAEGDMNLQIANGQAIANIINLAKSKAATMHTGLSGDGPGLGWPIMGFGILGSLALLAAAGLFHRDERHRWQGATLATGLGLAAVAIAASWIGSFTRSADPKSVTGAGSFIALAAAFVIFASGRSVVDEFRRKRVYSDGHMAAIVAAAEAVDPDPEPVDISAGALVGGGGA